MHGSLGVRHRGAAIDMFEEVAQRLGLKFAPKLSFQPDESFDEADRIEKLLSDPKVARDLDDED